MLNKQENVKEINTECFFFFLISTGEIYDGISKEDDRES